MKLFYSIVLFILFQTQTHAQYKNVWKDGKLTFITKTAVDSEGDENETDYDAGNDDVGINIEIIDYADENEAYLSSIEYASSIGCEDMQIEFKYKGGAFLEIHRSYYSVCYDNEEKEYIINAVIQRDDIEKIYDIAFYCYTISVEEGLDVLKSIEFVD
ncbi:hypothetical protein [Psychroserpens sp. MEBiC05023]